MIVEILFGKYYDLAMMIVYFFSNWVKNFTNSNLNEFSFVKNYDIFWCLMELTQQTIPKNKNKTFNVKKTIGKK